jgi:hypothetical protein
MNSKSFSSASLNRIFRLFTPEQLSSSQIVSAELSKIISLLLRDYISFWFNPLSSDQLFYTEIVQALTHIIQELEHRLRKIDWVILLRYAFQTNIFRFAVYLSKP